MRIGDDAILIPSDFGPAELARVRRSGARWIEGSRHTVNIPAIVFLAIIGLSWFAIVVQPDLMTAARILFLLLGAFIAGNVGWQVKRHWDRKRDDALRPKVIIPSQDLHPKDRQAMREVVRMVVEVADSQAHRRGHLGDGLGLLVAEQWRIAKALTELGEARRLIGDEESLPEHAAAVRTAEAAVARRVQILQGYVEAVRRVDQMLQAVDAEVRSETVHHKVRDAIAMLGDDAGMVSLVGDAGMAAAGVQAALEALRGKAESLRQLASG